MVSFIAKYIFMSKLAFKELWFTRLDENMRKVFKGSGLHKPLGVTQRDLSYLPELRKLMGRGASFRFQKHYY